ncbi:MAG: cytochrome C [Bacteroidetes bacterium]|nr:cytochrome C [Bacteroidota bacterium]
MIQRTYLPSIRKFSTGRSTKALYWLAALSVLIVFSTSTVHATPSYARQTNLACNACHYTYPELTPFGRLFKLNGYTMTGIPALQSAHKEHTDLKIPEVLPLSAMVLTSYNSVNKAVSGTSQSFAELPQQLSVFASGEVTPNIGTFVQITYDPTSGTFGMDNTDIRYANHAIVGSRDLLYGLTLNNNPTVQDVWNSTPAWGFPFVSSGGAPTPTASTMIEGALAGNVAGLGAYALYNDLVYGEISLYGSTPQGVSYPPDGTWSETIKGAAPYWRLALQHDWGTDYLEVGTYGMSASLFPTGITGSTDTYTDVAFDAQYEKHLGGGSLIAHTTYIIENQNLDATYAAGGSASPSNKLNTFKVDCSYNFPADVALTLGYLATSGTTDAVLYAPAAVAGSFSGSPNSSAVTAQFTYIPWWNTQFAVQYVAYNKFNGGSTNYDGSGRNASDNNTLYLSGWLLF